MRAQSLTGARVPGNATGPGAQFGGLRDVYTAAGYNMRPTYDDFLQAFTSGIARRIISIFPDHTWRLSPVVIDGDGEDGDRESPLSNAFRDIYRSGRLDPATGDTTLGLSYYLPELDKASLLGRWAVLFLGIADGKNASEPLEPGSAAGVQSLAYMSVYGERDARISQWDKDPESPRYGRPTTYSLTTRLPDGGTTELTDVHYSRVIHVAQGKVGNSLEGESLLAPVYTYLQDIVKVLAGSGEAAYRKSDPGMVVTSRPDYDISGAASDFEKIATGDTTAIDDQVYQDTKDAIDEYVHKLRRWLMLEGFEVTVLDGDIVDPSGALDAPLNMIASTLGIPKRLLLGNEAGELASSQDQENWASLVSSRQQSYAEPMILRSVVNRLVWVGVLPEPESGDFFVLWPSLYTPSPEIEAGIAKTVAEALAVAKVEVDAEDFVATYLKSLPTESVIGRVETPAPIMAMPVDSEEDTEEDDISEDEGEDVATSEAEIEAQIAAAKERFDLYP